MWLFPPERDTAGGEAGSENAAQAAGDPEQQPAGPDPGPAETDCVPAGAEHNSANSECQATGNAASVCFQK